MPRTLAVTVHCGEGEHEVSITVTDEGAVSIFSPCQLLPEPARKLAGSNCLERLPKCLVEELRNGNCRDVATKALIAIGAPAVAPLIKALRGWQVRGQRLRR